MCKSGFNSGEEVLWFFTPFMGKTTVGSTLLGPLFFLKQIQAWSDKGARYSCVSSRFQGIKLAHGANIQRVLNMEGFSWVPLHYSTEMVENTSSLG